MEPIGDIIRRARVWDRASAEQELIRQGNIAKAAQDFDFAPERGLVSYITDLNQREQAGEAAYDISSLLWHLAGIEPDRRQTFDTWVTEERFPVLAKALGAVRGWAQWEGAPFLTLAGPPGVGKSHLAVAACQSIVSKGNTVMYRRVGHLLDEVRKATLSDRKGDVLWDVRLTSFLILDDLGVEKLTEWSLAMLDEIVDLRYSMRCHLLVCTNLKSEDLPPRIGDRLADKAIGEVIQLAIPSFRRGR